MGSAPAERVRLMPHIDDGRRDAPGSSTPVPAWLDPKTLRWAAAALAAAGESAEALR